MSDKSQHNPTSTQPETSTSTEIQHDLASKMGGEFCLTLPLGNLSSLADQIRSRGEYIGTCSNDHDKSDHLGELFKIAIARLNESKRKESELLENNRKLKEENKRMQENDKLFSSELQRLLKCLKIVKPGIATPNRDNPEDIFSAVRRYLIESKGQQSSLSTKLVLLEGEKKKICEDLDVLKADLERANCEANKCLLELKNSDSKLKAAKGSLAGHRDKALQQDKVIDEMKEMISHVNFPPEIVSRNVIKKLRWLADEHKKTCQDLASTKADLEQAHRELDKSLQETKKISEDLDTAKLNLEQAILEASSAKDETKKSSLELQKRNINLKATEDRALAWDNVIGQTNEAISGIKFPPEIVSRDIAHKIRWLANEHKKICEDLDSTKADLEQAHKELDKCSLENKKISEALDTTKLNVKQAIHKANSCKDETKNGSWELRKCYGNLKAAERSLANHRDRALEQGKVIDEMMGVISHINLPQRIISRDIAPKVRWLADEHKKTCEDLDSTKADLEQANFRADKCCTELKAAELKVKGMDKIERIISPIEFPTDIQTKDTSTKVEWLADYYKKNFIDSNIGWNPEEAIRLLGNMKAKIVDEVSETVRVLVEKANVEATGMEDPDPKAYSSASVADASQTELAQNTREATTNQQNITHAEQDSGSGERITVEPSADDPNDAHQSTATVMQQQAQVMNTASSNNGSASEPLHSGYGNVQEFPPPTGTRWGEYQTHYPLQQQQALIRASGSAIAPQTFHNGAGAGYGYSPFWQFGAGHYHFDASGQMCYMPCYDAHSGGAVWRVIRPPMVSNFVRPSFPG